MKEQIRSRVFSSRYITKEQCSVCMHVKADEVKGRRKEGEGRRTDLKEGVRTREGRC